MRSSVRRPRPQVRLSYVRKNILREHTAQLRSMVERLRAEFVSCSPSRLTPGEIDVLKRAAKKLERTSAGLAEDPKVAPEAKHDAGLRLEIARALRRIAETLESREP